MAHQIEVKTLTDPVTHSLSTFCPDRFAETAANGEPFNSIHLVYLAGEYIGIVFKQFSDDPWQYATRGEDARKDVFETFECASLALVERFKQEQEFWREWVKNPMFSKKLA